jgi:hypothetical protein
VADHKQLIERLTAQDIEDRFSDATEERCTCDRVDGCCRHCSLWEAARTELRKAITERDELRGALIACGREAGAILSDQVATEFLKLIPGEVKAKIAALHNTTNHGESNG